VRPDIAGEFTLDGRSLLITGGTGSLGTKLTEVILARYPGVRRLVIFSRDEQKQFLMEHRFPVRRYPALRYFIGDVRDLDRLKAALNDIDYVIHTAAMKHVPIAEYNPMECVKTNVVGAENLINAVLASEVTRVVALSTDKAAAPINLYGATKLTSDKLFIAANNIRGTKDCRFSVVRYGNVMGSNGSVIPFFLRKRSEGVLPITHPEMTRFNISLQDGVDMVLFALANAWGGELFVPKIPSFRILDLATAVAPSCRHEVIGIRAGEKLHEEMITSSDSYTSYDIGQYFAVLPQTLSFNRDAFVEASKAAPLPGGFNYSSGTNDQWLSVSDLRRLIRIHVDPAFTWETY
jgi:UDP-N-acetylglucosamine 4,6-dehydratase (inverting)